jgi:FkbM family methyltransferase
MATGNLMRLKSLALSALHLLVAREPFRGRGLLERAAARYLAGPGPVRLQSGFWMNLDLANPYERLIFLGAYEASTLRLVRHVLRRDDFFVDGGANIGLHTLSAAKCTRSVGTVIAFEPDNVAFAIANANIALNASLGRNIVLKRSALGDRAGVVFLCPGGDRQLESRVLASGNGGEPVPCTTIDEELSTYEMRDRVVLCKLDVEGYEDRVLDGASRLLERSETIFICELNDELLRSNGSSADALIARFLGAGYAGWSDAGAALGRHDPSWPPWANGIFAKGAEAYERVRSFFGSAGFGDSGVTPSR